MATTINYPTNLPPPVTTGYEIDDMPSIARDDMDSGRARQRLRNTALVSEMPIQFQFKQWQYMVFEAWLRWKVGYTAWFNITIEGGVGLVSHEARFKADDLPKAPRQKGGWYFVTGKLEVIERPMLSSSDLDLLIAEDGDALLASLAALHTLMSTGTYW